MSGKARRHASSQVKQEPELLGPRRENPKGSLPPQTILEPNIATETPLLDQFSLDDPILGGSGMPGWALDTNIDKDNRTGSLTATQDHGDVGNTRVVASGGLGEGGPTASVQGTQTLTGTDTDSLVRSAGVSYEGNKAVANVGQTTKVKKGPDTTTSVGLVRGGYDHGTGGVLAGATASQGIASDVGSVTTTARVDIDTSNGVQGIDAAVGRQTVLSTNKTDAMTTSHEVTARNGQIGASTAQTDTWQDEGGAQQTHTRAATVTTDGNNIAVGGSAGRATKTDVAATNTVANASLGTQGGTAGASHTRTLASNDTDSQSRTSAVQVGTDGSGSMATGTTAQFTDANGAERRQSSNVALHRKADGSMGGAASTSKSVKNADGSSAGSNASVRASTDGSFAVAGGRSNTDANGRTTAVQGNAGAKLNKHGQVESVQGSGNVQVGAVNVKAGVMATFGKKQLVENADGGGVMTIDDSIGGSAGGGASRTGSKGLLDDPGKSANVGIDAGMMKARRVHRVLTKAQVKEFKENGKVEGLEELSLDNLDTWQVGEGVDETSGHNLGGKAGVDTGVVEIEAGLSTKSDKSLKLRKVAKNTLELDLSEGTDNAINGGLKNKVAHAGHQRTKSHGSQLVVRLDLEQIRDPKAVIAYIREHGQAPEGVKGVVLVKSKKSAGLKDKTSYGVGGLEGHVSSGTNESVETDGEGRVTETREGYRGAGFMSHSYNDSLTSIQNHEGDTSFLVSSTVNSDSAWDAQKALARGAGMGRDVHDTHSKIADASGNDQTRQWGITYELSEETITQYLDKLRNGQAETNWLADSDDAATLNTALLVARGIGGGDPEAATDYIRRALARYVKDGGSGAIDSIRKTMGIKPEPDLKLAGDEYMNGPKWRFDTKGKTAEIEAALAEERPKTARRLYRKHLAWLRARKAAIADHKRYPDLPSELRSQQLSQTSSVIREFRTLRTKIRSQIRTQNKIARSAVDASMGSEMDEAFGEVMTANEIYDAENVTKGTAGKVDHAKDEPMGPVRPDYVPEPTTKDLVKQDLQEELDAEEAAKEAREDKDEANSPIIEDETDSDELVEMQRSVKKATKYARGVRARYRKTQKLMMKAAPTGKPGFVIGMSSFVESGIDYELMNTAIKNAQRRCDSAKDKKYVMGEVRGARALGRSSKKNASRAIKHFKSALGS